MSKMTTWHFGTPVQARNAMDELRSIGLPVENLRVDEPAGRLHIIVASQTEPGIAEILVRHGLVKAA